MILSSPPSSYCEFPTEPTVELRRKLHRRGKRGRPSADGVEPLYHCRASVSYHLRWEKGGLKLPALVGCDLMGTAETSNPDGDEGLRDCFGGDLRERKCLRPTGVPVYGSETVPEARRDRQCRDQVDTHIRKTCRREVETPERGLYCHVTLEIWQGLLARVYPRQSFPSPGHTNRWDTNLTVALVQGWLRSWRVLKTWRLKEVVVVVRGCGVDVSQ